jgi:RNA polymerase sigma-70 factor (ECF subfamily)
MLQVIHRLRSDEALMQAYQRGDCAAFECLYHRHKNGLFTFLYRACSRRDIVEELTQDAWAAVVKGAADYQPRAGFRTWLYQIARNRLVDHWRRADNRILPLEAAAEPAAPAPDAELGRRLLTAIAALPAEQRDTLLLQQQGFTHAEIADITGAGAETVKSRLRYARGQLREQLGDDL